MPPNGSATSSKPDTSRQATLTSGASLTLPGPSLSDTRSVTSSLALADGPLPSDSRDGRTTDLFGQVPVPASPSPQPGRARRPMTDAICGLRGFLSSPSATLQSSLESRLMRQLDGAGSTLFSLIWKAKATPAGRPYCQLAASARRTTGPELGSWPTPMAGTPAQKGYNEAGNTDSGRKTVSLCAWATPTARDGRSEWGSSEMMKRRQSRSEGKPLSKQAIGAIAIGSAAQTGKRGLLSPDHSRWLMGYGAEHLSCAPTATPSSRKSRRSLSSRPNKRD